IINAVTELGHDAVVMQARSSASSPYLDPVNLHNLLEALQPSHLILGPGPGTPMDADITVALAHHALAGQLGMPVLGICLGHQALALADGYSVIPSPLGPVHGSPVPVEHEKGSLFSGLESPVMLTRYNSLVIQENASHALEVCAREMNTGLPMGLVHPTLPIHSLQVHPESVGSELGMVLMEQFLQIQSDG
ncbi:MAG: aminodeoxychorismate/anthranilate synthase component II, partial [Candidatus Poseidonia sp.]|nr:aminodeoxychorismate/anthranilate synthase component II [Poseidonia sp.]